MNGHSGAGLPSPIQTLLSAPESHRLGRRQAVRGLVPGRLSAPGITAGRELDLPVLTRPRRKLTSVYSVRTLPILPGLKLAFKSNLSAVGAPSRPANQPEVGGVPDSSSDGRVRMTAGAPHKGQCLGGIGVGMTSGNRFPQLLHKNTLHPPSSRIGCPAGPPRFRCPAGNRSTRGKRAATTPRGWWHPCRPHLLFFSSLDTAGKGFLSSTPVGMRPGAWRPWSWLGSCRDWADAAWSCSGPNRRPDRVSNWCPAAQARRTVTRAGRPVAQASMPFAGRSPRAA